jgi:hypothetical protein
VSRRTNTLLSTLLATTLLAAGCGGATPEDEPATAAPVADTTTGAAETTETAGEAAPAEPDDAATDEPLSVAVTATPDAKAGVNVEVVTTGFRWAPEHASGDPVDGEGHAHLYVDGEKVGRLYAEWTHLMLPPGEHTIEVTLNGNDHEDLVVGGEAVRASTTVEVPEPAGGH